MAGNITAQDIVTRSDTLKRTLDVSFRDKIVESVYADAEAIAGRVVQKEGTRRFDLDQRIDRIVTSKIWGLPLMGVLLRRGAAVGAGAGDCWRTRRGTTTPDWSCPVHAARE